MTPGLCTFHLKFIKKIKINKNCELFHVFELFGEKKEYKATTILIKKPKYRKMADYMNSCLWLGKQ